MIIPRCNFEGRPQSLAPLISKLLGIFFKGESTTHEEIKADERDGSIRFKQKNNGEF